MARLTSSLHGLLSELQRNSVQYFAEDQRRSLTSSKYCSWHGLTSPEMALMAWQLTEDRRLARNSWSQCPQKLSGIDYWCHYRTIIMHIAYLETRGTYQIILHYEKHLKIVSKLHTATLSASAIWKNFQVSGVV